MKRVQQEQISVYCQIDDWVMILKPEYRLDYPFKVFCMHQGQVYWLANIHFGYLYHCLLMKYPQDSQMKSFSSAVTL